MKFVSLLKKISTLKFSSWHINLSIMIILLFITVLFLSSNISVPIFYKNGLAHSVIMPILIGLIIMALGAEIFGWTFSGLIVPGFLAPIILIEPLVATVMITEAIISYYCVLGLSNLGTKTDLWSEFFGRERFFAILLISTGVRLLIEGTLIPIIGRLVIQQYQNVFDYQNSLYSIGFIVVPLLANMFWNTGLKRAIFPIVFSITLTCIITYYFLVNHTNFSIGYFWLIFEQPSIGFTANPKAHIILLTSAFIASHANLRYGWDFNGIMTPALLALIWPTPLKLLFTVIEALFILFIARFISTRKKFETTTLEGPRKTVLLFTISFLLKMATDAIINLWKPGFNSIDFYGYGYLLSTLLAAKMWQKRSINTVLIPTLRVSLIGAIIGHLIGFSLTLLPINNNIATKLSTQFNNNLTYFERTDENLYKVTLFSRGRIKTATPNSPTTPIGFAEYERFNTVLNIITNFQSSPNKEDSQFLGISNLLSQINYETVLFKDQSQQVTDILLRESNSERDLKGWGLLLFSVKPSTNLIIVVPNPVEQKDSLETAILMYQKLNARALIVAGAYKQRGRNLNIESVLPERSIFNLAIKKYIDQDTTTIEIHSSTREAEVIVYNELATNLNLHLIKELTGDFNLVINKTDNSRAKQTQNSYIEVWLNNNLAAENLAKNLPIKGFAETDLFKEGFFYEWIQKNESLLSYVSQNNIQTVTKDEITFLDEQVLTPLFTDTEKISSLKLKRLQLMSYLLGYRSVLFFSTSDNAKYLILTEQTPRTRYLETIIVRLTQSAPLIVEVPNTVLEKKSLDFALRFFENSNATVMLISGASFIRTSNMREAITSEIFNIAHQRAQSLLSYDQKLNPLVIQFRSTKILAEEIGGDVVISAGSEIIDKNQLLFSLQLIINKLTKMGHKVVFYDGSKERIMFNLKNNPQKNFSDLYFPKTFLSLWVAPNISTSPKIEQETKVAKSHALALKLEIKEGSLAGLISASTIISQELTQDNFEPIIKLIKRYQDLHNINDLKYIISYINNQKYQILYYEDKVTSHGFLVLKRKNVVLHIFRITNLADSQSELSYSDKNFSGKLSEFIFSNQIWLKLLP